MRVPTITTYNQATYQLGRLTSDLSEATEEVSTGIAVDEASDDPSAMAQVLSLNSTISVLTQTQANIDQGLNVLTTAETALGSMADILLELELLASQMANATANSDDRAEAAEDMQNYLEQLVDLANTEAYGGYIFAGDENQVIPFTCDDEDNTEAVFYSGSDDALVIKTGDDTTATLDLCGCDLFYEDEIDVDESNYSIVFEEDPNTGTEDILTIETQVPSGSYTREELALAVETAMNEASLEQGYGITYEVSYDEDSNAFSISTDGSYDGEMTTTLAAQQIETPQISNLEVSGDETYDDIEIEIIYEDNVTEYTPDPEGSAPLTLTYSSDDDTWTVENDPGYGIDTEIEADGSTIDIDLDNDGVADITVELGADPVDGTEVSFDIVAGYENNSILPSLGFDDDTVTIDQVTSTTTVADSFTVTAGENDAIDFVEILAEDGSISTQLTATIEAGTYSDPESYAEAVEDALEEASAEYGNRVNYEVVYNEDSQTFTIKEDTDTGTQLSSFELLFNSGTNSDSSAADDLGFSTDESSAAVEGEEATWSIFDTILDFEEALASNDVDAIQKAMIQLQTHYDTITDSIASVGREYSSLTSFSTVASSMESTLTVQLSDVQDSDTVAAIMELNATQTAYEAALAATSQVLGMSLVDYM